MALFRRLFMKYLPTHLWWSVAVAGRGLDIICDKSKFIHIVSGLVLLVRSTPQIFILCL